MTQTIECMDDWKQALRSGDYRQIHGVLCKPVDSPFDREGGVTLGYCCLGVADKVCFGAEFRDAYGYGNYSDDVGFVEYLPTERADKLNLNVPITSDELKQIKKFMASKGIETAALFGSSVPRQAVLVTLNDARTPFPVISEFIEYMEWDKEVVNG